MFNNREIALLFYGLIGIVFLTWRLPVRITLLKAVFQFFRRGLAAHKIRIWFLLIIAWLAVVALITTRLGVWDNDFIKPIAYWLCLCGLPLAYHGVQVDTDRIQKLITEQVALLVLLTFLINTYVYSLPVELLLVGLVLFVQLGYLASTYGKADAAVRLFGSLEAIMGFAILGGALWKAITDVTAIANYTSLIHFSAPIVLTLTFIPLVYLFALWSSLEQVGIRIQRNPNPHLRRTMWMGVLRRCGPWPSRIKRGNRIPLFALERIDHPNAVDEVLDRYLSAAPASRSFPIE